MRPSRTLLVLGVLFAGCSDPGTSPSPNPTPKEGTLETPVPVPEAKPIPPAPPAVPKSAITPDAGETKSTASGLKYCVLRQGKGTVRPKLGDMVKVHYTGWLTDGTEFDSSRRHGGQPVEFVVGNLVPGWNEALAMMTAGTRWKITLPPELGYGHQAQASIPAGSTLIFDMELLHVRAMPEFRAPDPAKMERTPGGTGCQVLEATEGAKPGPDDLFEMEYAIFLPEGRLLQSDATTPGHETIQGKISAADLPFLKEVLPRMRVGETWLVDVPRGQGPPRIPGDGRSVWRLRLLRFGRPADPPKFVLPPDAELTALPSGLKMKTLAEGKGECPTPGDRVVVHYAGWLSDGSGFDSSWQRGLPTTFGVGDVIPGWQQALQAMRPGGEAIVVIPPALGYGARGAGEKIPPNATLVFRMQLLEVKP